MFPVLASNIQPLPEVLGPNNGTFFAAGNVDDLLNKINYCHKNRDKIKELAEKARDFATTRYSLKTSVKSYEQTYRSLLHT